MLTLQLMGDGVRSDVRKTKQGLMGFCQGKNKEPLINYSWFSPFAGRTFPLIEVLPTYRNINTWFKSTLGHLSLMATMMKWENWNLYINTHSHIPLHMQQDTFQALAEEISNIFLIKDRAAPGRVSSCDLAIWIHSVKQNKPAAQGQRSIQPFPLPLLSKLHRFRLN